MKDHEDRRKPNLCRVTTVLHLLLFTLTSSPRLTSHPVWVLLRLITEGAMGEKRDGGNRNKTRRKKEGLKDTR